VKARPKLVILGGGFSGLRLLFHLHRLMDITLVDPRTTSLVKPMLVEVALTGKPVSHVRFELAPTVRRHGARLIHGAALHIDADRRTVTVAGGEVLSYDYLAIVTGAEKDYGAVPGLEEFGYSVCDDEHAPRLWRALENFTGGPIVTGAASSAWGTRVAAPKLLAACEGPIGEVAFMAHHELATRDVSHSITVFSPAEIFFEDVGAPIHDVVGPLLSEVGVEVHTSKVISDVGADHVSFVDGSQLESSLSVIIPPYAGPEVVRVSGLGDGAGFLPVDEQMRFLDDPHIFGAGDATALSMPKLGHIAVHQADLAAAAIREEVTGSGEVPPYCPEVFCIMNRGGVNATLILSDSLYGGTRDLTLNGPIAHLMKWSFDSWSFHTRGHLPPEAFQRALELVLR
jgi:sulfide:quinone oxidoreductase